MSIRMIGLFIMGILLLVIGSEYLKLRAALDERRAIAEEVAPPCVPQPCVPTELSSLPPHLEYR